MREEDGDGVRVVAGVREGGKGVGGGEKGRGRKEQGPVKHIFQFNLSDLVLILISLLTPNTVFSSTPGPQFNFVAKP